MQYLVMSVTLVLGNFHYVLSSTNRQGYYLNDHQKFNLLPRYPDCGRGRLQPAVKSRIKGGKTAAFGEFPWMVHTRRYQLNTFLRCGGSLISDRYVVSAAHCYVGKIREPRIRRITIFLGDYYLDRSPDCMTGECIPPEVTIYATHVYLHAKFNSGIFFKDIALLRLKDKTVYGDFIRPICLPFVNEIRMADFNNYKMTAIGWGKNELNTDHSDGLWKLTGVVSMKNSCASTISTYGYKMWNFQQCFSIGRNKSTCTGDSGGPVMLETRVSTKCRCTVRGTEFPLGPTHYVHYLMAVNSFGFFPCFGTTNADQEVHTRIIPFLKWILDRIVE